MTKLEIVFTGIAKSNYVLNLNIAYLSAERADAQKAALTFKFKITQNAKNMHFKRFIQRKRANITDYCLKLNNMQRMKFKSQKCSIILKNLTLT